MSRSYFASLWASPLATWWRAYRARGYLAVDALRWARIRREGFPRYTDSRDSQSMADRVNRDSLGLD